MIVKLIVKMNKIEFYEALAHLFYAIANAKRRMSLLEQKRINDIVRAEWNEPLEEFDSEVVLFGIIRRLAIRNIVWRVSFNVFKNYYKEHEEEFTDELREKIMRDVESINLASQSRIKPTVIMLLARLFWD